jgi:histidinol dehydrogenase
MRVVRGIAEARKALCDGRGLNLAQTPPHVQARINQVFGDSLTPIQVVELILKEVRQHGDSALRELTRKLDGAELREIEVPLSAIDEAYESVSEELVEALTLAAGRIRQFQEACKTRSWVDFAEGYGQLINPVQRVGAYVPGGTARYPSTVLMTAIPAKVAGVTEVIVCTPAWEGGLPHPVVLVAADIAGVDRVFRIGGAQAIAAMAYGTETVPRVDMICGPGNIFVTLAKKLLFGEVGIDGLYGPTETVVVADESANPTLCAADLLAQAEHDPLARPVLITTSASLAAAVEKEARTRLERLDRASIAKAAMEQQGCIAIVSSLEQALELANQFAPEHISLMVKEPWAYVGQVRNAGAVFLGEFSHEVLGDYVAGPSHVMPTGGTARFSSGLGVHSFVKISPVTTLDRATASELSRAAALIARAEGLTAHAEAAEVREELNKEDKL